MKKLKTIMGLLVPNYLLFSFCCGTFDITQWPDHVRALSAIIGGACLIIAGILMAGNIEDDEYN